VKCPDCQRRASEVKAGQGIASGLPEGMVVLVCRHCRSATIDGSGTWVDLGPGLYDSLLILATKVKGEQVAFEHCRNDDSNDPKWETFTFEGKLA
jgi:NMD protein affecting ribosome stability and mRNA decay